jgi:alpha-1,3-glucan synthase
VKTSEIPVDEELEAAKPDLKRQAQDWAKLKQDPKAELFVFVGRWSQQKGIDLIADVFPSVMEHNPQVQLICVGPVIDLYGKFAAMKLARMMDVYPGRVFSKPEFTALPPYIFSGADFALMPSRDEPFGLVAVEFGRKGALCVGARVGGLGQMPGWWFTIESTTTKHVMQQLKYAISGALASKPDVRAIMRARAAKQRFPVAQWVEDLEILQSTAIEISHKQANKTSRGPLFLPSGGTTPTGSRLQSRRNTPTHSRNVSQHVSQNVSRAPSPVRGEGLPPLLNGGLGSMVGPGHKRRRPRRGRTPTRTRHASGTSSPIGYDTEDTSDEEDGARTPRRSSALVAPAVPASPQQIRWSKESSSPNSPLMHIESNVETNLVSSASGTTLADNWFRDEGPHLAKLSKNSVLSLPNVIGGNTDYKLQHVSPFFTDPKQEFTVVYEKKLENLNGKSSEDALCIEEYLVKSEKTWFGKMRDAQMGRSVPPSPAPSVMRMNMTRPSSPGGSSFEDVYIAPKNERESVIDEFLLGDDYVAPTGLKHGLRLRIGEWPLYSILLAFVSPPLLALS